MDAFDKATAMTKDEIRYLDELAPTVAMARRSLRLTGLMENGSASVLEFLQADFGTRTPNGLDLQAVDNFTSPIGILGGKGDPTVKPGALSPRAGQSRIGGLAFPTGEIVMAENYTAQRNPETGKLAFNHDAASILSHEFFHQMQFHAQRSTGDNPALLGRFIKPLLQTDPPKTLGDYASTLATTFRRAVVNYKQAARSQSTTVKLAHIFGRNPLSVSKYLTQDHEIQARMHEILTAGYCSWGKMPASKLELHAAFYACGAELSGEALHSLHSTEEGRKAVKEFQLSPIIKRQVGFRIQELNDVTAYALTREARDNLWQHAIPGLYGNMLELYGDSLGRERMDLGANRRDITAVLKLLQQEENPDPALLAQTAARVSPENAAELVSHMLQNMSGQHTWKTRIPAVLDQLLLNPLCREAIIHPQAYSTYGRSSLWTPMEAALATGHTPCLYKMVNAGADLYEPVRRYNPVLKTDVSISPLAMAYDLPYLKQCKNTARYEGLMHSLTALNEDYVLDRDEIHALSVPGHARPDMISFNAIMSRAGLAPPPKTGPGTDLKTDLKSGQNQPNRSAAGPA